MLSAKDSETIISMKSSDWKAYYDYREKILGHRDFSQAERVILDIPGYAQAGSADRCNGVSRASLPHVPNSDVGSGENAEGLGLKP